MFLTFFKPSIDDLGVETLSPDHAVAIADIHAKTFKHHWTDGEFVNLLGQKGVCGHLLREQHAKGGKAIGFVLARVVADEAEILTIAVTPRWQNLGVGRKLMEILISGLHAERIPMLFLEVAETNKSAVSLYRRIGFSEVSERPDYYRLENGGRANALVMRKQVG